MGRLTISDSRDTFTQDGKPFFYLADTVWTAFSNPSLEEWREYLDYRAAQGFNALQINILTQWDAGKPDAGQYPFRVDEAGRFDFGHINEEYFSRARTMLAMARERGFTPALVVLWGNYVKDTWMSDRDGSNVMPYEMVEPYVEYVVNRFRDYHPIYIAGGDTNFGSEQATRYYLTVLRTVKRLTPDALTTIHLGGGLESQAQLPEALLRSPDYDFYLYQSSHGLDSQKYTHRLAQAFYQKPTRRPVVNGEPCYEGHYFGGVYGRFSAFDVRRAIWSSLLSGAAAGVTYGAHGMWGWYRDGKGFLNESYGGTPLPWRTALRLPGAWDASFAKWIFEQCGLFRLEPKDAILNETEEIRLAVSPDGSRIAIYAPYNCDILVALDLRGYDWTAICLAERKFARPTVLPRSDCSVIKMHDFNSDCLLVGIR